MPQSLILPVSAASVTPDYYCLHTKGKTHTQKKPVKTDFQCSVVDGKLDKMTQTSVGMAEWQKVR